MPNVSEQPSSAFDINVSRDFLKSIPDLFDHNLRSILTELFQNARRAGASEIKLHVETQGAEMYRITVTDNGCGSSLQKMLGDFANKSRWSEEIQASENPAGMGVFSLYSASKNAPVEILSNGEYTQMGKEQFTGDKPVEVHPRPDADSGTSITFTIKGDYTVLDLLRIRENHIMHNRIIHLMLFTPMTIKFWYDAEFVGEFGNKNLLATEEGCVTEFDDCAVAVVPFEDNHTAEGYPVDPVVFNFHGCMPRMETCATLSVVTKDMSYRIRIRVDVRDGSAMALKLPDRNVMIEDPVRSNAMFRKIGEAIANFLSQEVRKSPENPILALDRGIITSNYWRELHDTAVGCATSIALERGDMVPLVTVIDHPITAEESQDMSGVGVKRVPYDPADKYILVPDTGPSFRDFFLIQALVDRKLEAFYEEPTITGYKVAQTVRNLNDSDRADNIIDIECMTVKGTITSYIGKGSMVVPCENLSVSYTIRGRTGETVPVNWVLALNELEYAPCKEGDDVEFEADFPGGDGSVIAHQISHGMRLLVSRQFHEKIRDDAEFGAEQIRILNRMMEEYICLEDMDGDYNQDEEDKMLTDVIAFLERDLLLDIPRDKIRSTIEEFIRMEYLVRENVESIHILSDNEYDKYGNPTHRIEVKFKDS